MHIYTHQFAFVLPPKNVLYERIISQFVPVPCQVRDFKIICAIAGRYLSHIQKVKNILLHTWMLVILLYMNKCVISRSFVTSPVGICHTKKVKKMVPPRIDACCTLVHEQYCDGMIILCHEHLGQTHTHTNTMTRTHTQPCIYIYIYIHEYIYIYICTHTHTCFRIREMCRLWTISQTSRTHFFSDGVFIHSCTPTHMLMYLLAINIHTCNKHPHLSWGPLFDTVQVFKTHKLIHIHICSCICLQ
jgi:hypothetical protein